MSDERFKEIIDDISHGRPVKMSNDEYNEISWRYVVIPSSCANTSVIIERKKIINKNK